MVSYYINIIYLEAVDDEKVEPVVVETQIAEIAQAPMPIISSEKTNSLIPYKDPHFLETKGIMEIEKIARKKEEQKERVLYMSLSDQIGKIRSKKKVTCWFTKAESNKKTN